MSIENNMTVERIIEIFGKENITIQKIEKRDRPDVKEFQDRLQEAFRKTKENSIQF